MEDVQNEEMEVKKTPLLAGVRWGVVLGVISAIITLLIYVINPALMIKWWFGLGMLVVFLGLVVYGGISYRKDIGGYIDFGPAYLHGLMALIISGLIGTLMNMLLYYVIDPNLPAVLTEAALEQTRSMMEGFGAPADSIDDALEQARAQTEGQFTMMGIMKQYFIGIIIYAVLALITGLIVRRREAVSDVV